MKKEYWQPKNGEYFWTIQIDIGGKIVTSFIEIYHSTIPVCLLEEL